MGDRVKIDDTYKKYKSKLRNFCRQKLIEKSQADDVVQEAFELYFKSIGSFRGETSIKNWLYKIAYHQCLKNNRRYISYTRLNSEYAQNVEYAESVDEVLGRMQLVNLVLRAIRTLPRIYRDAIVCSDLLEMTIKDTAWALSINESNVKVRIYRARNLIRGSING